MKLSSIENLFKLAGGSIHIAVLLNVHQYTALSWMRTGIPIRHWRKLIDTYNLTVNDLFNMSERARADEK